MRGCWAEPAGPAEETIGEGLWALPGLVDAHAHLAGESLPLEGGMRGDIDHAAKQARQALAAGVNHVYDKGWSDETVLDLIEDLPPSERPDIEAAGEMIAVEGGYYGGFAREISPDDIASVVAGQAAGRAKWIKLIGDWPRAGVGPKANFGFDQLSRAVKAAESGKARVAIHTMAREVPSMAVRAGVHSIEHGLFLEEGDLDLLAESEGIWVPTVRRVEETTALLRPGSSGQKLLVEGLENVRRLLPLAYEAGVTVLTGTDLAGPTSEVAKEALKLVEYGATPAQALASVSKHVESPFAMGRPADAVLFPENPLDDLRVLQHPASVVRLGRVR